MHNIVTRTVLCRKIKFPELWWHPDVDDSEQGLPLERVDGFKLLRGEREVLWPGVAQSHRDGLGAVRLGVWVWPRQPCFSASRRCSAAAGEGAPRAKAHLQSPLRIQVVVIAPWRGRRSG